MAKTLKIENMSLFMFVLIALSTITAVILSHFEILPWELVSTVLMIVYAFSGIILIFETLFIEGFKKLDLKFTKDFKGVMKGISLAIAIIAIIVGISMVYAPLVLPSYMIDNLKIIDITLFVALI